MGGDDIAEPRCAVGIGLAQVCRQPTSCRSPAKADELTLSPLGLIARIYEVFPLPGQVGADSEPPHIASARGPPLWEDCDAQVGEGAAVEPDWDLAAQATADFEVDQRVNG